MEINFASKTESIQIIADNADVISALVSHFKKPDAAFAAVATGTVYPKFFSDRGLKVPLPALLFGAFSQAFSGRGPSVNENKREARDAIENVTYVAEENNTVVHLKVSRVTDTVTAEPADAIGKMVGDAERTRPGFTRFAGQIVSLYDFTGKIPALWSASTAYEAVQPLPYPYASVARFILTYFSVLHSTPPASTTPMNVIRLVIERIRSLSLKDYLEMSTSFYMTMLGWEEDQLRLDAAIPVHQIGRATIDGVPFFKHPSVRGLDKGRIKYYLYQNGPWKVEARPPSTQKQAIECLQKSRAHRREDKGGYSCVTRGHAEGGDLPDMRVDVTRVLGLVLPLLRAGKNVDLKATLSEVAQHVQKHIVDTKVYAGDTEERKVGRLSYIMEVEQAIQAFGLDHYKLCTKRVRSSDSVYISMVGMQQPTVSKGENVEEIWMSRMLATIPDKPYIIYTKVCTGIPETHNVFKFGSSHSFDFVVSSESEVSVAGKIVSRGEEALSISDVLTPLKKVTTSRDLLSEQFRDDRRKLSLYSSMVKYTNFSPVINLWSPPPFFTKKMQSRIVVEIAERGRAPEQMLTFEYEDDPVVVAVPPAVEIPPPPPVEEVEDFDFDG